MKLKNITISSQEKLSLLSNLSTMITAGIPIISAVNSLLEQRKGNTKKILEEIRADLLQGKHLYTTFSKFPRVFNIIMVNILKSAEHTGTLDIALKDLKEQVKSEIEFNSKIRSAMLYPILVFLVFIGVMLLMFTVVMPNISKVFSHLKVTLPLPTRIMIFLSNMLLTYTLPIILGFVVLIALVVLLFRLKKHWVLQSFYSLPIVSGIVKEIDLTRFSRSLHLLLSSGIMITSALELTEGMVIRKDIAQSIKNMKNLVYSGKTLSTGLRTHKKAFPEIMAVLAEAGEKTGTLEKSMLEISEYYDAHVTDTLKTLTTVLEPVLLIVIGVIVGSMMLAIIAPIYGLIGNISPK